MKAGNGVAPRRVDTTRFLVRLMPFWILSAAILFDPAAAQNNDLSSLRTRAEATNFEETTRYDEVVAFLNTVAGVSDDIHLTSFGFTTEGRALPLAVFGVVEDASPQAAVATSKTRVFVQANIHAGEVCGKEAMLMLLRDLAVGKHVDWKESLVLLIAPIYNADGNERVSLYYRPRQHGPIGGMGQRSNAQDYDLNRDHMKIDTPEARSLVGLMNRYDPHVLIDLHTTNGTRHAYHLTYSPPLNPNTPRSIDSFLRRGWLPAVTKAIKLRHGWDYYYYGNLPWRGMNVERGWYTFDHRPRFNNNYVGLRNRFAILSEAYSYASFEERILASLYFVEEIVNFAHTNAAIIKQITEEADKRSVVGESLAVRARHARSTEPVEILLGEVDEEKNPYTGETILRRTDARNPEKMYEYGTFEPTESVVVPQAYFVPNNLTLVADRLEAHGIEFRLVEQEQTLEVERFRIDSTRVTERAFQGHNERTLFGEYESTKQTLPSGTLNVPVDQPLGRLAFYLLEPRSDDGLVNWALLDEALEEAEHYPILRQAAK